MTIDLLDLLINKAQLEDGISIHNINSKSNTPIPMVGVQIMERGSHFTSSWSDHEDEYIRKNLGFVSEEEMAKTLGRTKSAVRQRWNRDLNLIPPSRDPNWISSEKVSYLLGVEEHAVSGWCNNGLIPYRLLPMDRKIRVIHHTTLDRWVISTSNWIYFDHTKIVDERLRRLCALRAERWGDEWWSTAQAAKELGVTTQDMKIHIYKKRIPAVQLAVAKGGRNPDPAWRCWYILKSDALKAVFVRKGVNTAWTFTPRGAAWALKARLELKLTIPEIKRSMKLNISDEIVRKELIRLSQA